jgi:hypothetical protein
MKTLLFFPAAPAAMALLTAALVALPWGRLHAQSPPPDPKTTPANTAPATPAPAPEISAEALKPAAEPSPTPVPESPLPDVTLGSDSAGEEDILLPPNRRPELPQALEHGFSVQQETLVRIRELKTEETQQADVRELRERARQARTEEARRVLMRNYYTLVYTRMIRREPTLKPVLEAQLRAILLTYEQNRIRPTLAKEKVESLSSSRSADYATPAPTPKGAKTSKKKKTLKGGFKIE